MRIFKNILWIVLLVCYSFSSSLAQDKELKSPRIDFTCLKRTDGSRLLNAKVYLFEDRQTIPIRGIKVNIVPGIDTLKLPITTDENGVATLLIDKATKLDVNSDGFTKYSADFAGNDTLEPVNGEILEKEAFLKLYLKDIDSVRTVKARFFTKDSKGDTIPLAGETVNLYVPRLFSLFKFGEETTDDDGFVSVEFPNDLPGEQDGTISIIAKIEDNETYGNIETKQLARWGIPVINRIPETHRALWGEIAPVWMIITLSILLIGVWGHYIYVIVQLILVKKERNKQKA